MPADPYAIFLDTQVFEAASFNFKMTALASLEEQVQKGTVRLIITDITVRTKLLPDNAAELKLLVDLSEPAAHTLWAQLEGQAPMDGAIVDVEDDGWPPGAGPTWICSRSHRSVKVVCRSSIKPLNISKASCLYSTNGSFWPHAR